MYAASLECKCALKQPLYLYSIAGNLFSTPNSYFSSSWSLTAISLYHLILELRPHFNVSASLLVSRRGAISEFVDPLISCCRWFCVAPCQKYTSFPNFPLTVFGTLLVPVLSHLLSSQTTTSVWTASLLEDANVPRMSSAEML